jgi:hypothetical protein
VSGWNALAAELDRWQGQGRQPTLWWRDDDACRATPALATLLAIAGDAQIPVALAAVPAALERSLVDAVAGVPQATVLQHGYAHRNHAPPGARNWELGSERPLAAVEVELADGRARLQAAFGPRFRPVLVPPWNRIAPAVAARLPAAGLVGLSTFGPRDSGTPFPGLHQCNTHVDLIAWRRGRVFIGADAALERITAHLAARRAASVDAAEPTGVLTHHLDFDADAWEFMAALAAATRRQGAAWVAAAAAFSETGAN